MSVLLKIVMLAVKPTSPLVMPVQGTGLCMFKASLDVLIVSNLGHRNVC